MFLPAWARTPSFLWRENEEIKGKLRRCRVLVTNYSYLGLRIIQIIHKPPVIQIIKISNRRECFLLVLPELAAAAAEAEDEVELLLLMIMG